MSSVTDEEDPTIPVECLAELKCGNLNSAHGLLITEANVVVCQIMKCEDFSSYRHLIAVTAVVLKFCRLLCSKIRPGVLDMMSDESKAEELWTIEAQKSLVSHKSFKQWKTQFNLFRDDKGIWRCRGRLQNAAIPYTTKYPVMLTSGHHFTTLLVRRAHERVIHNGVKETLTDTDHADVQKYLTGLGVKWIFNVPKAPWWGGVFERMIQSTKRCLRKIIGKSQLTYDELLTALTEIELVVNSRPLSYVSEDDLEEALTPSHLLVGRRLLSFPDHLCTEPDQFEPTPDILTRRVRHLNHALDSFWKRWRQEYLLELCESHRHHRGNPNPVRVAVGDVVVIHSDNQPRGFWKLGRVQETLSGLDGEPRAAVLRVQGGGKHATLLCRPVQRLYPLEITGDTQDKKLTNEPLNSKTLSGDDDQEVSKEDNSSTGFRVDTDPQEISVDTSCPQRVESNGNSDNEKSDDDEDTPGTPPTSTPRPQRATAVTARTASRQWRWPCPTTELVDH